MHGFFCYCAQCVRMYPLPPPNFGSAKQDWCCYDNASQGGCSCVLPYGPAEAAEMGEDFRSHTLRTIAAKRALDPRPPLESLNEPDLPLSVWDFQ